MSMILEGKKVLFFSPVFFGYEYCIKMKMEELGAKVVFYDERNSPNTIEKILIRLNLRFIVINRIIKYYKEIISRNQNIDFDYVLFFNPETITTFLLKDIKNTFRKACFILYMWDSFKNKKHSLKLLPFFDKTFSFDNKECIRYGMKFRPLFFVDKYDIMLKNCILIEKTNGICFIGTIHSDRYKILDKISKFAKNAGIYYFFYLYLPSRLLFIRYALFDKYIRSAGMNTFQYKQISINEVYKYLSLCKIVIDIQHPKQTGLTLRTIEMLGMKKKLITTNKAICNYDFYDPNNILVIDRDNVDINPSFLQTDYIDIDSTIRKHYSLSSFIEEIITN